MELAQSEKEDKKGIILHQTFSCCTSSRRIFSDGKRLWLGIRDQC